MVTHQLAHFARSEEEEILGSQNLFYFRNGRAEKSHFDKDSGDVMLQPPRGYPREPALHHHHI